MRNTWIALALCVTLGAGGCATLGIGKKKESMDFIEKTMVVDGKERTYAVYVPDSYKPKTPCPLVVFLHGAGERGQDGRRQTQVGIGPAILKWPERFPCIVLMPQCPSDAWWSKDGTDWSSKLKDGGSHIDESMRLVLDEYNVDPKRIYLTGLSMGGYGTWTYGVKHIDTFAALMTICGGGRISDAETLATVPIRVFHGGSDSVVPPAKSREMVDAVRAAGGDIEYTEYPGVDHNSWDATYSDPDVIAWLLSQRKD